MLIRGPSDCGFADNLGRILVTFKEKNDEIKNILSKVGVNFEDES